MLRVPNRLSLSWRPRGGLRCSRPRVRRVSLLGWLLWWRTPSSGPGASVARCLGRWLLRVARLGWSSWCWGRPRCRWHVTHREQLRLLPSVGLHVLTSEGDVHPAAHSQELRPGFQDGLLHCFLEVLAFDVDGPLTCVRSSPVRCGDALPVAERGRDGHQHLQLRIPGGPERRIVGFENLLLLNRRRGQDLTNDPVTELAEAETWVAGTHEKGLGVHLIPFG